MLGIFKRFQPVAFDKSERPEASEKSSEIKQSTLNSKKKRNFASETSTQKSIQVIAIEDPDVPKEKKRKIRRSKSTKTPEAKSDSDSEAHRRWSEDLEGKKRKFLTVCDRLFEFFEKANISIHEICHVWVYMKRMKYTLRDINEEQFLYALYIASSMLEDEEDDRELIVDKCVGLAPKAEQWAAYYNTHYRREWRKYLRKIDKFHDGYMELLEKLDWRTLVQPEEVLRVMKDFPPHAIFQRVTA